MKLFAFIFLNFLPFFIFAQGNGNLVFHFQTKANYVVSDYDLIVGDDVTVWKEVSDPKSAGDAPEGTNAISGKKYERKILFKKSDEKVCISKYDPWKGLFYLGDTISSFPWRMEVRPEKVTILGYTCDEASMTFRGRSYHVWYTPQIPLSEGPWKLSGLPGMILKVEATGEGDTFKMECYEIERHSIDTKALLEDYLRKENIKKFLSWPEFVNAFEGHLARRTSELKAEMAADGDTGFSMHFRLENDLEIFSPELQGNGIVLEF